MGAAGAPRGSRHRRHPGIDRGAGPIGGGDRPRPRGVGQRYRAGALGARGDGGGRVARDRPADRPDRGPPADRPGRGDRPGGRGADGRGPGSGPLLPGACGHGRGRGLPPFGGVRGCGGILRHHEAPWAMGWVVGAQSLAWILGNPVIGVLAESSWRLSYAVPAVICLAALCVGLGAAEGGPVAARGEDRSIRAGLAAVFSDDSARRWATAELVAYSAWTAELTYAGAFYIQEYGVSVLRRPWACCWRWGRSSSCSRR